MFEWDDHKDAVNIAKHGVSFAMACRIFNGPIVTVINDRLDYGEMRQISIGVVDGLAILTVVHTQRDGKRRIISARPASRQERRRYVATLQASDERH